MNTEVLLRLQIFILLAHATILFRRFHKSASSILKIASKFTLLLSESIVGIVVIMFSRKMFSEQPYQILH